MAITGGTPPNIQADETSTVGATADPPGLPAGLKSRGKVKTHNSVQGVVTVTETFTVHAATPGGATGSITFTNGVMTSQVLPT